MSVSLFLEFVKKHNLKIKPVKSNQLTSTAQEAARVHSVPVCNIVKSLLVKRKDGFFLFLCPGDKRLDLEKIGGRMATADEVKKITGHSIGGVPPFGHKKPLRTIIIEGFDKTSPLWAAAGAQDTNFKLTLSELQKIIETVNNQTSEF